MTKTALVYIELNNSKIEKVCKEIVSKANELASDIEVNAVVIADKTTFRNSQQDLALLNVKKLFIIEDNIFDSYQCCLFSSVLSAFINENKPDIFLMGATENGRELAPRTASALNIGLTADCTDISVDESFNLLATRPTYGGKMMATIISETRPNFATIRPGAFKIENTLVNNPEFVYIQPETAGHELLLEVLKCETKQQEEDWTCSDVIIAGGLGLKTKENFEKIYTLCSLINAKPAASRAAVELGWAPSEIQVGQTGNSVSPKLYIALGISGAMQHMTGITNADKIVAVNTDRQAPIMSASDIAIESDAAAVLQSMIEHSGSKQALL